jgi:hypothetical protein
MNHATGSETTRRLSRERALSEAAAIRSLDEELGESKVMKRSMFVCLGGA